MGGENADISAIESAMGIVRLYDSIKTLETGSLYSYDGKKLNW